MLRSIDRDVFAHFVGQLGKTGLLVLGVCLLWHFTADPDEASLLPSPGVVADAWMDLLSTGKLGPAVVSSVRRVFLGFVAATTVAAALALALSRFRLLMQAGRPLVEFLRSIAPLAWIPLAIKWFGVGDPSAVFIVAVGAFFPIFLNMLHGVQSIEAGHIDAARAMGAGWWLRLTHIAWPSAKPLIITGLRLGLGVGWMSLIAAELTGTEIGLGYLIEVNRFPHGMPRIVAVMGTIGVIGLLMNSLIELYAWLTMPWWQKRNVL